METLNTLIAYAVQLYGRDRSYKIRFGGSTPIVSAFDGDDLLAELWTVNKAIRVKKFY